MFTCEQDLATITVLLAETTVMTLATTSTTTWDVIRTKVQDVRVTNAMLLTEWEMEMLLVRREEGASEAKMEEDA